MGIRVYSINTSIGTSMPSVFLERVSTLPSSGTCPSGKGMPPGSYATIPRMFFVLSSGLPTYGSVLRMGDEYGGTNLVEQGGVGIGIDLEIYRADGGCHLSEILVECFRGMAELYALEVIRPNAHAEAVNHSSSLKAGEMVAVSVLRPALPLRGWSTR